MAKYAQGGNVRLLRASPGLYAFARAASALPPMPPTRWQRVKTFIEDHAFVLVLPIAIAVSVLSLMFLILVAVGIQSAYGVDVSATAGGFSARVTEVYNWPDAVEALSWLWLVFTGLTVITWVVFALAVMDDWYGFAMHMLVLLALGVIGVIILGSVGNVKHGVPQPYARMQDQMNNWIVNTLHVPGEINITDETAFTRDYLRYDVEHEPVYFTVKSTRNTVTVTPRAQ